jgi:hypothetical protein
MQKWEYKIVYLGNLSSSEPELNRLGSLGWELVTVDESSNYYFKRLKS